MQPIDKPDRARQLARAIASDLTLYHEKEIVEGIENDSLFQVMKEHIEEGRALFKSRVTPDIYELNLYDRAIVDVMIKSKGHVKSKDLVDAAPDDDELDDVVIGLGAQYDFVVEAADDTARLDVWLAARRLPISRSQIRRRIEAGEVTVNGQTPSKPALKLRAGDRVVFRPAPPEPVEDLPEDIPLSVIYEDAQLIVVDKPAGMVVHPATSHQHGTLVNALLFHCGASLGGVGGQRRPGIVHRLDKDTSGVLVVAKDEPTLVALQTRFAAHDLERRYLALVEGVLPAQGSFKTQYGRDPRDRKKFSSRVASGRRAVTHYTVVERFAGATLVEAKLETGRTHQIRVHFKDAGHPLIGDRQYGRPPREPTLREVAQTLGRQALHAHVLGLPHPADGRAMRWTSPPPADFAAALSALRDRR